MKKTTLTILLAVATTNVQADPATLLSVASIVSSIPGHIERFTGTRSTTGIGEYSFGPDISENTACKRAEDRAKLDAIRNVLGEDVVAQQSLQCKDTDCKMDTDVWSLSDAHLRKTKLKDKSVTDKLGTKVCTVTISADVSSERPYADLHIDSKFSYKDGEQMKLQVNATEKGNLNIFHVEGNKAARIFPNAFQTSAEVESISIPTSQYSMIVKASKFDESLVFVLTKKNEKFLQSYDLTELNNKLLSIPVKDRKIVRRNLVIEQ